MSILKNTRDSKEEEMSGKVQSDEKDCSIELPNGSKITVING